MRFCVCIKQVPDVAAPMHVRDGALVLDIGRTVLNAYDASAVEAALALTEQHGGEVEVILIGPERAAETVRKALAMGADRGRHLITPDHAELDSAAVAAVLAEELAHGGFHVVLTGKQAQDTDAGLTGTMLAEWLGLPYATNAVGLEIENGAIVVTRQGDRGQEVIELPTPCLVTCSNDMNDPRIPNLKGIMAAKKKPLDSRPAGDLPAPRLRTLRFEPMPARQPGEKLVGAPAEIAGAVVRKLDAANVV